MAVKNLTRFACIVGATMLAAANFAGPDKPCTVASQEKARELLRRSLINGERVALNAVVLQRATAGVDGLCQFAMTQDVQGRQKKVAVKPLVVQGMMSIDDGREWTRFFPDQNRMIVMPSPRGDREDVESRLKLAFQNYRFAIEPRTRIAGRMATVVVAVPKYAAMPIRKFTIDDSNNVLLRVEAFNRDGDRELFFDTKAIQFTSNAVGIDLTIHGGSSAREYKPAPPTRIRRLSEAKAHTGFTPLSIPSLPNGFEFRETVVAGRPNSKFVAMRLTDGLVWATLYQFAADQSPPTPSDDELDFTYRGVTLRLAGELSEEARLKMMSSIAKSYGRTVGSYREPLTSSTTFSTKRMPEPEPEESNPFEELIRMIEEMIRALENELKSAYEALPASPAAPSLR